MGGEKQGLSRFLKYSSCQKEEHEVLLTSPCPHSLCKESIKRLWKIGSDKSEL